MDLIFPSGLRITLPEEAKEECEFIKTVLELEQVNEIPINLPFELTDTYLKKYELSNDELSELTEEELSKWLQFKSFLGYCESGNHYDGEMIELRKVINEYKENGIWSERRDDNVCNHAAENGYLKVLKYAHENGCPWHELTCSRAARYNGNLDCLKYAHENGCPWDVRTSHSAAKYGNLDCLKYAHENGCPVEVRTINFAAKYDHQDCLEYAYHVFEM